MKRDGWLLGRYWNVRVYENILGWDFGIASHWYLEREVELLFWKWRILITVY